MSDVAFYDPVRRAIATPLDYAIGPSNGNRAVTIPDALRELQEDFQSQLDHNTNRIAELTELRTSVNEAIAISALRHREAATKIRSAFDEIATMMRRREEELLRRVTASEAQHQRQLDEARASIEGHLATLTSATCGLQQHNQDPSLASSAPMTEGVAVISAWLKSQEHIHESSSFSFNDDTIFTVVAHDNVPQLVDDMVRVTERSVEHSLRPLALIGGPRADRASAPNESHGGATEPNRQSGRAMSLATNTAGSDDIRAIPPKSLSTRLIDALPLARGLVFQIGCAQHGALHPFRTRSGSTTSLSSATSTSHVDEAFAHYRNALVHPTSHGSHSAIAPPVHLDVFASVPIAAGDLKCLAQAPLFGPRSAALQIDQVRTMSLPGAVVWWDFGAHAAVELEAYGLVHGGTHLETAMRGWAIMGTNDQPPYYGAVECRDRKAVEEKLLAFCAQHCVVLHATRKEAALGMKPLNTFYSRVEDTASRTGQGPFRFLGIRVDEPSGPAKDRWHVHLAGVEWYGRLIQQR